MPTKGLFDSLSPEYEEDQPANAAADRVIQELDDQDIDDEMEEAEKRLSKAAYYKAILKNGVIEDDGSDEASEINTEARVWAKKQMARLLNLTTPEQAQTKAAPVESPFNEQQIMALRQLANRSLEFMGAASAPQPVVKKVQTPVAPTVKKIQTRTKAEPKSVAPQPKPQEKKKALRPKKVDGEIDYASIPVGEPFKDKDGLTYKFVDNPNYDPGIENSKPRIRLNITQQAVNRARAYPTPNKHQMESISYQQATQSVSNPRVVGHADGSHNEEVVGPGGTAIIPR